MIEQYFQFRWANDRNLAIKTDKDQDLFRELPRKVRSAIYIDFLFKNFMVTYSKFLRT